MTIEEKRKKGLIKVFYFDRECDCEQPSHFTKRVNNKDYMICSKCNCVLRDDFVPDSLIKKLEENGIDTNKVGFVNVTGTKDDPTSHGIHLNEPYKIVYKNSRKPKRKIIMEFMGYGLVGGLTQLSKTFEHFVEENKEIPIDEVGECFRGYLREIVETWGCQKMGLSTRMNMYIPKDMKRDIKKDKDNYWISLILGFYCRNFISDNKSLPEKHSCRTITITDELLKDEEIETILLNLNPKKYPNPLTDEEKDNMREDMKNNGFFTYSYS